MICKNCKYDFEGNFCNNIKELLTRPGNSIREYLEGKRKKHYKPLAFVFLMPALYTVIKYLIDIETLLGGFVSGIIESINETETNVPETLKLLNWLANNYAYSTLLFVPFFSFASYLAFKKSKYNYFELLVLNFYTTGQQNLIYLMFSPVFLYEG